MNVLLVVHDDAAAKELVDTWQLLSLDSKLVYLQDPVKASAFLFGHRTAEQRNRFDLVIVSDQLSPEQKQAVYRLPADCFLGMPDDLGLYFRLAEQHSAVSAHVLIFPACRARSARARLSG